MAAYLKDVENDMKDLTAESILLQKRLKPETSKVSIIKILTDSYNKNDIIYRNEI